MSKRSDTWEFSYPDHWRVCGPQLNGLAFTGSAGLHVLLRTTDDNLEDIEFVEQSAWKLRRKQTSNYYLLLIFALNSFVLIFAAAFPIVHTDMEGEEH